MLHVISIFLHLVGYLMTKKELIKIKSGAILFYQNSHYDTTSYTLKQEVLIFGIAKLAKKTKTHKQLQTL